MPDQKQGWVKEAVARIEKIIKEATKGYLTPDEGATREITRQIMHVFWPYPDKSIQLEVIPSDDNQKIVVKPKNLFTLLLLNGYYVAPGLLEGKDEWVLPDGSRVIMRDGEPSVIPAKPADSIELRFTIEPNGELHD